MKHIETLACCAEICNWSANKISAAEGSPQAPTAVISEDVAMPWSPIRPFCTATPLLSAPIGVPTGCSNVWMRELHQQR